MRRFARAFTRSALRYADSVRRLAALAVLAACSSDTAATQPCPGGPCPIDAGVTTPGALGDPCGGDGDCESGLACLASGDGFPGGVCSLGCAAVSCPSSSVCVDVRAAAGGGSACLAACSDDGACRSGYTCCKTLPGGGACVPTDVCPATGLAASPDLGAACASGGGACAAGEACRTGAPFPDGACTRPCVPGNPDTCPPNGRCVDTETGAWCLATCGGPGACRSGYDCVSAGSDSVCRGAAVACVPGALDDGTPPRACTPGDMPPLAVGNGGQPVGPADPPAGCVKSVKCAALPAGQMQALGAHAVGDVVEFDVPDGTAGLSVISQAVGANDTIDFQGLALDNSAAPTQLTAPDGTVIYDDTQNIPGTVDPLPSLPAFFSGGSAAAGALTIPNTTSLLQQTTTAGLPAGRWKVTVNDYALECTLPAFRTMCLLGATTGNRYDVQVLLRPGPLPATGAIDVGFYLVTSQLTATSAVHDPSVARMVQTLSKLYAGAGICLSRVTFYDVPAWARARYASGVSADRTNPCGELSQMFTLSQPGNTLDFFLVEDIMATSGAGGSVVGIDGTIPAPSGLGGTVHSGAAVSIADLRSGACANDIDLQGCGPDVVAYIAAHEGGHWLGLYHTSEATGDSFDTVSDTPLCKCQSACVGPTRSALCGSAGGANPTLVNAMDCDQSLPACQGSDNLMFWQINPRVSVGVVSPQQAQVMRANPLVR